MNKPLMHALALTTILLWSLNNVLTRIAVGYFAPEAFAFLRYGVASLTLLIYAAVRRIKLPALKDVPLFFLGGAMGFAVYILLFNNGVRLTAASTASFVNASIPVITAVLARLFLKERLGLAGWISVAGAFTGVGIITLSGGGLTVNAGALLVLLGAVLLSGYNIFQRRLLLRYTPLEVTTYCITAAGMLLSVFAAGAIPRLMAAPPDQVFVVLFTGVFTAAAGFLLWAYALRLAERTRDVTNYMFLIPLVTTLLAYVMIGEVLPATVFVGGAVVLISVLGINVRKR
jgi:drug/metabolite transporter (DMT)-like permease